MQLMVAGETEAQFWRRPLHPYVNLRWRDHSPQYSANRSLSSISSVAHYCVRTRNADVICYIGIDMSRRFTEAANCSVHVNEVAYEGRICRV